MKNKIHIVLLLMLCLVMNKAYSQLEVHNGGKISIGGFNLTTRPSCHTFINGSNGGADNSLVVRHNNSTPNTQAISSQLVSVNNTSYEIHVNNSPGAFYVNGAGQIFYSGGWLMSDSSTKKNIRKIENPLERINKIGGYSYNKKSFLVNKGIDSGKIFLGDTLLHEGVMADEIEKIAPYMVKEMANGKKAVDYVQLIPLLIESVKELDKEKTKQEEELALLKARFNKLGESIDTSGGNFKLKSQLPSSAYLLYQNSPNPFNTETQIKYDLKSTYSSANIFIFDLMGTLKKSYKLSDSNGSIIIKSSELNAGMYLYSLIVDGKEIDTKRMLLTN